MYESATQIRKLILKLFSFLVINFTKVAKTYFRKLYTGLCSHNEYMGYIQHHNDQVLRVSSEYRQY